MNSNDHRAEIEYAAVAGLMNTAVKEPHIIADFFAECPVQSFRTEPAVYVAHAMAQCFSEKGGIDVYRVAQLVREGSESAFANMGGAAGIAEMFTCGIAFEHDVLNGARAVQAEHLRHSALTSLQGIASAIVNSPSYGPDEIAADLADVEQVMRSGSLHVDFETWDDYFSDMQERISKPDLKLVKTPWVTLNDVLYGGAEPEELVVIAGRPGTGKTAFAINWSVSTAAAGKCVAFTSLEVSTRMIRNRMLASTTFTDYGKFRKGMTSGELEILRDVASATMRYPIEILDKPNCTVSTVRKFAKRCSVKSGGKLGLIVVDYLQLMRPEKASGSREQDVAEMSRSLKLLAREMKVPVVLLAQMNRQVDGTNREPMLSDLRESGAIEQDADIVIFLHGVGDEKQCPRGVKAYVKKGRSSGQGVANLVFNGRRQLFYCDVDGVCARTVNNFKSTGTDNGLC